MYASEYSIHRCHGESRHAHRSPVACRGDVTLSRWIWFVEGRCESETREAAKKVGSSTSSAAVKN
jgi:hypothetical protein